MLAPSRGELKNLLMGSASSSRCAISRGGGTMRNSRGEKKIFLGVLAPSHGEFKKIFRGLASSFRHLKSRGGEHHEKILW